LGDEYDMYNDGVGAAQTYDRYGSPSFTPFKRAPSTISDQVEIIPVLSPNNSEDAIIWLINSANDSLLIEQMYIYPDLDDILDAIISAHNRGVNCSVIQAYGISESENDVSATILEQNGIPVRRLKANSSIGVPFDVQHNKGVIVDGRLTLISSINWSPTSIRQNREAGVIVISESVANYYTDLFNYDWDRAVDFEPSGSEFNPVPTGSYNTDFQVFSGAAEVICLASPDNCFDVVNDILASANASIYISVYTLSSPYLIETLNDRLNHGVEVKMLLEKYQVSSTERQYNRYAMYNHTIENDAKGLWASSSFTYQHCKYAVIDNKTLIISSGNWGRSSCPKPQDDGDVDGNRDWWFVIYGNAGSSSSTNENDDLYDDQWIIISGFDPVITTCMISVIFAMLIYKSKKSMKKRLK
ncbi:MAG: phospholipase D-like domain-containing protein, partial [Promethearchaeota archaeon]